MVLSSATPFLDLKKQTFEIFGNKMQSQLFYLLQLQAKTLHFNDVIFQLMKAITVRVRARSQINTLKATSPQHFIYCRNNKNRVKHREIVRGDTYKA